MPSWGDDRAGVESEFIETIEIEPTFAVSHIFHLPSKIELLVHFDHNLHRDLRVSSCAVHRDNNRSVLAPLASAPVALVVFGSIHIRMLTNSFLQKGNSDIQRLFQPINLSLHRVDVVADLRK